MASSMLERPGLRSESHEQDHLRSFIASKQAYLDAKAAQQRAEHAAEICKAAPFQKANTGGEVCALNGPLETFAFARGRMTEVYRSCFAIFGCQIEETVSVEASTVSSFQSVNLTSLTSESASFLKAARSLAIYLWVV